METGDTAGVSDAIGPLLENSDLSDVAYLLQALMMAAENRRDDAEAALATIVSSGQAAYDTLCLAGDIYLDWHKPLAARRAFDQAIILAPHASHAHLRRGRALSAAGDVTAALADFERATLLQPNLVDAHIALGDEYRDASMMDAATTAYRKALSIDPGNTAALSALDTVIGSQIPAWHAPMLNDARRNDAFDTAIRRAVQPGAEVLDIGTGTGLLAMMAARAGAGRITACEAVGPMADTARDVIQRNGLSDRIEILHKRSSDLVVGDDLVAPADVLIAEIVDAGLLGENILATITDARARLLKPDAIIIPKSATVFAVPIECAEIASERVVDTASGFDISPFNDLMPRLYQQTFLMRYEWRPLAAPAPLFHFDFAANEPDTSDVSARITPIADGTAHAIALWFILDLDDKTTIATGPTDPPTHWGQAVYAVNPATDLKQNEPVRLIARHDGRRIMIELKA
jgi:precorrin-6B methylase 2